MTISRRQSPAEPSSQMGPAAALYTASCSIWGGPYDKPWCRRTA
ncbi:hypothetical protein [Streptomyces sp. CA-146814]